MLLMGIYSSLIVYLRQAIVKKQSYNRSKIKISLFAQLRLNLGFLLILLFSLDDLGLFFLTLISMGLTFKSHLEKGEKIQVWLNFMCS